MTRTSAIRLAGWRDRLLADRRFLRFAARFPLTRPIARHHARALFDLCAGAAYAQTLSACVELQLFDLLAAAPQTTEEVATATGLPADGARTLLVAAAGLGLLRRRAAGRWGLGTLGAAARGNPGVAAMITHHAMLYDDLRDPVGMLRQRGQGRLGAYWGYAGNQAAHALRPEEVDAYSALMAASQPMIADEVLAAYDFRAHRCLLDVGGGSGMFVQAVAAQAPALRLMLLDLPAVANAAAPRLAQAGLRGRVACVGGSFLTDPLPQGADIISLVRVLHDHDDDVVQRLLRAAHAALPPGGRVLIAEPMADTPQAAAYFSWYLRAMGSGRPRRAAELKAMLHAAGFVRPRLRATPTPLLTQVLIADVNRS